MHSEILLFGKPGSGKSTQAASLLEYLNMAFETTGQDRNCLHLSIGDRLRGIRAGLFDSRFKPQIMAEEKQLRDSRPLEHHVVNGVVEEVMESTRDNDVIVLDGYPRFASQLDLYLSSLRKNMGQILCVVELEISNEEAIRRILSRGSRLGERSVTPDFMQRRLDEYDKNTRPTIDILRKQFQYASILANTNPAEVFKKVTALDQIKPFIHQ